MLPLIADRRAEIAALCRRYGVRAMMLLAIFTYSGYPAFGIIPVSE